ncbi:uncharacterized protein LOC117222062 isoform X2 [Megalopta genalis]|uniref:uncharacterized protein LOC117222062 isoform X2 n=1 Tax=Megalopta genalis TaxID=115081 RepID=UPI003FCF464B
MAQEIPETTYVPEVAKDARKERERRTVQDGTALWKRRKEELERRKHREQRELQQILENYSPWGKPGGGAPCAATLRKKNVPLEPIEAIESLVRPESLEQGRCRNFGQLTALWPWGRPGPGGVPWRDPKLLGARFLESLGWTSDATIERIHRKHINPMDVTDTNRFFDDKGTMSGVASGMPPVEEPMRRYNDEVQVYELTGGVELVPLLTSRRYYSQQPQSTRYVATDATRPGYTIEPRNDGWNKRAVAGTSTPGGGSGVGRVMAPPWIMPIVTIYTTFSTVRSSIEFPSRTCHGAYHAVPPADRKRSLCCHLDAPYRSPRSQRIYRTGCCLAIASTPGKGRIRRNFFPSETPIHAAFFTSYVIVIL